MNEERCSEEVRKEFHDLLSKTIARGGETTWVTHSIHYPNAVNESELREKLELEIAEKYQKKLREHGIKDDL